MLISSSQPLQKMHVSIPLGERNYASGLERILAACKIKMKLFYKEAVSTDLCWMLLALISLQIGGNFFPIMQTVFMTYIGLEFVVIKIAPYVENSLNSSFLPFQHLFFQAQYFYWLSHGWQYWPQPKSSSQKGWKGELMQFLIGDEVHAYLLSDNRVRKGEETPFINEI